eukprot:TRINITY_DN91114_c0_g1_i1.p1 TRINITY_DN91114_c0_g1~~TRINITY_DN91114_c0_g1_i1.p1  ORF type:complete len:766 (+),score=127.16 TRINITY_DN91114_c0_g1_i1:37-2334(+)
MGNRVMCGGAPQTCVDECARLQFEIRSRDAEEPECDPAGAVFQDTLRGLPLRDQEGLLFSGTSNLVALRWLLMLGANPKARDRNNTTMLHAGCRGGSLLTVQELVRRGLPLDAVDSAGWTPLHVAAMMGRRDLAVLLLHARANISMKNKKGQTALALCGDISTREVLRNYSLKTADGALPAQFAISAEEVRALGRGLGELGDDPTATCEPFFVPRPAMFKDEESNSELISIGLDLSRRSCGHALAFFVATGAVHDHPTDLSTFIIQHKLDPAQLGEFLGEDFSLAQTLRLAFVHTMELHGTGVVGALRKVFRFMRPPTELSKLDRITAAAAHLWWRTHEGDDFPGDFIDDLGETENGLEFTLFAEDTSPTDSFPLHAAVGASCGQELDPLGSSAQTEFQGEVLGAKLRASLRSVEGLARLMFSTVMLCWNINRVLSEGIQEAGHHQRRLSFQEWHDTNANIEADGKSPSAIVQKSIFKLLAQEQCSELLPDTKNTIPQPQDDEADSISNSTSSTREAYEHYFQGWANIPPGGLERNDAPLPFSGPSGSAGSSGPKLAHCILSETSSSFFQYPTGASPGQLHLPADNSHGEWGEAVWLTLRHKKWLFLSAAPQDPAPYAFIRLRDAVLRDVSYEGRSLIVAGRKRIEEVDLDAERIVGPFGDTTRHSLPLCFLLADGRFQPFEALWLELQFASSDELQMWAGVLGSVGGDVPSMADVTSLANVSSSLKVPVPAELTPRMSSAMLTPKPGDTVLSREFPPANPILYA